MKHPLKKIIFGSTHFVPKNLNFWYVFGALLLFALVLQYLSGLWLAMFYQPSEQAAFASVQHIMRDVPYGWLIRYLHTTCASAIFLLLYLHMIRGLLYRSYRTPRQWVWYLGVLLFWLMMCEAFLGYLLPWGQMSYWGATVVTNLFSALPYGDALVIFLRGDYHVSGVTLTRFYALHIIALPILLVFVIQWHIRALHQVGSGNSEQLPIDTRSFDEQCPKNCRPFFPGQMLKDGLASIIFLMILSSLLFFIPNGGGLLIEPLNYLPADPMQTPEAIRPIWYLSSYYGLLRAVPHKVGGMMLMLVSLFMWLLVPWLDRMALRRLDFWHRFILFLWIVTWIALTYLGMHVLSPFLTNILLGLSAVYLLLFFLVAII